MFGRRRGVDSKRAINQSLRSLEKLGYIVGSDGRSPGPARLVRFTNGPIGHVLTARHPRKKAPYFATLWRRTRLVDAGSGRQAGLGFPARGKPIHSEGAAPKEGPLGSRCD